MVLSDRISNQLKSLSRTDWIYIVDGIIVLLVIVFISQLVSGVYDPWINWMGNWTGVVGTITSIILTGFLVYLYYLQNFSLDIQNQIQQTQNEIQETQTDLMRMSFVPDIEWLDVEWILFQRDVHNGRVPNGIESELLNQTQRGMDFFTPGADIFKIRLANTGEGEARELELVTEIFIETWPTMDNPYRTNVYRFPLVKSSQASSSQTDNRLLPGETESFYGYTMMWVTDTRDSGFGLGHIPAIWAVSGDENVSTIHIRYTIRYKDVFGRAEGPFSEEYVEVGPPLGFGGALVTDPDRLEYEIIESLCGVDVFN